MTLPREKLRQRAESGVYVTAIGGGGGAIGAFGLMIDVPHAEYLAVGGGLVFVIGICSMVFRQYKRGVGDLSSLLS